MQIMIVDLIIESTIAFPSVPAMPSICNVAPFRKMTSVQTTRTRLSPNEILESYRPRSLAPCGISS